MELEVGKVIKSEEDLFFAFHFWKRRKIILGLPKWEFSTGKKHFTPGKKTGKMTLPSQKNMPVTPLLAVPNQMNQRHSVSHGIDGGVHNMVNALYIQHESVAWGSKGVDFVFHILGDHPRFTAKSSIVTQVVLNNLTFVVMDMCGLFQSCSSFQNAHQASDFRLLRSLEPDATMEPRYLKSDTWLIGSPQTWGAGWGLRFTIIYSVFGALMTRPRSAAASAVLVSWACAREIEVSSMAMSSAKSRSFNDLAACRLEWRVKY